MNYEVFSGREGSVAKAHSADITSYQEAKRLMQEQLKQPNVVEVLICKNGEPYEYASHKGHFML